MSQVKAAKRRYDPNTAPPALTESGLPQEFWPTRFQFKFWWQFVTLPVTWDEVGRVHGACPLHNKDGQPDVPATFNFPRGHFICSKGDECYSGQHKPTLTYVSDQFPDTETRGWIVNPEPVWDVPLSVEEQAELDAAQEKWDTLKNKSWRRDGKRHA
jgi:hypothetical protein